MKRKQMNSVARSLCGYLMSRNNDIGGYWGIGWLCRVSKRENKWRYSFKIYPGKELKIYGYVVNGSTRITENLIEHSLDSIEGRISFFEDGRYPNGSEKYTCGMAIALTQEGRTGMYISHVECWPHSPSLERRSTRYVPVSESVIGKGIIEKIKRIFR